MKLQNVKIIWDGMVCSNIVARSSTGRREIHLKYLKAICRNLKCRQQSCSFWGPAWWPKAVVPIGVSSQEVGSEQVLCERRAQLRVLGWDFTHVADMETKDDSEVDQNCDQCGIIQPHGYYHLKCMWTSKPCCQCKYHFVLMAEEGRGLCISPAIFSVKRHSLGEQFT